MRWYLDGVEYHRVTADQVGAAAWDQAVQHGVFLVLDVAVGGGLRPSGQRGHRARAPDAGAVRLGDLPGLTRLGPAPCAGCGPERSNGLRS
ncbi:hypothetical protein [Kitasatospora acidiphila]|uniref:hypothetical protein n=1 Tax=Kitasatospora acidiphila TaxID=2567942 RepID=UPI0015F0B2EC|nr:hypothetical protein [Kitasatospora acidiphila]